ncbi:hypothetical protein IKF23_01205, partial [Candidatus Saccharibacteria bacterium]|nr:hypothetical protein [Candidatus Saccharibacteria bacterium]
NVTQYYMQDLSNPTLAQEVCTTDRPSIVIDKRDEQAYTIQRLPDGKCWMLDNLNLDLTNASIVAGLSPENTNADAEALNYLRNGGGTADDQWATAGLSLTNWDTAGTPSVPWVNIRGKCDSSINSSYPCIPNDIAYTSNNIASNSEYGLGTNRIGIYYNYCAVSAGSYCWGKNHMESTGYNIVSDICPASWRLPAGGPDSTSDFYTLCKVINNNTACGQGVDMSASNPNSLQYILSLPLSGDYRGGSAWFQGVANRLWSTSYYDPSNMYGFGAFSSRIQAWSTNGRNDGRSVRCLLGE